MTTVVATNSETIRRRVASIDMSGALKLFKDCCSFNHCDKPTHPSEHVQNPELGAPWTHHCDAISVHTSRIGNQQLAAFIQRLVLINIVP